MTGIPVISIGPSWHDIFPYGPDLFEGHELASGWSDEPGIARAALVKLLNDPDEAKAVSEHQRARAIATFGIDTIREQWREYLR